MKRIFLGNQSNCLNFVSYDYDRVREKESK